MKRICIAFALAAVICSCAASGGNPTPDLTARYLRKGPASADEIPALFAARKIEYQSVKSVNWPEKYAYCPDTKFAIACTEDALLLHFKVSEEHVRATKTKDQEYVFMDSCVEFFVSPARDSIYYNIEFNCIGTVLMAGGPGRRGRTPADEEVLAGIRRWSSLGRETFPQIDGGGSWELAVIIPWSSFFLNDIHPSKGMSIRANVNKCIQGIHDKHFVTWRPIHREELELHSPEAFGEIQFR